MNGGCASLSPPSSSADWRQWSPVWSEQYCPWLKQGQEPISFVGFLCPSVSAAIVALATKLGLLYQSQHYGRMQRVYDQARQRLRRHPAGATLRIATALGEEALLENESWGAVPA